MIQTDVVIIGAGPCGLFQVFELGLLDLKAQVLDALPVPGGQCAELYPDKPIYDIPGFPIVGAQELVDRLQQQIKPFSPGFHLGQQVQEVKKLDDGTFRVVNAAGTEFQAKAVIIAGGVGAFQPVQLRLEGLDKHDGKQLFYKVKNPTEHHGKKVLVCGGGDSALDCAQSLAGKASEITLVHRSAQIKAAPASVSNFKELAEAGKARLILCNVLGFEEKDGLLKARSRSPASTRPSTCWKWTTSWPFTD